tara:strand:+ start:241 stop:699 length:459 start_codon:yes stop_codon:yes gene_type:complete
MAKISNTAAYPNISNIDAADYLIITDKENSLMTKTATLAQVSSLVAQPYTSYVANFTQSGGAAPVVIELQNTTGKTFVWSRSSPGVYDITPSVANVANKAWWMIAGYGAAEDKQVFAKQIGTTNSRFVNIDTTTGVAEDVISSGHVEIRIYP